MATATSEAVTHLEGATANQSIETNVAATQPSQSVQMTTVEMVPGHPVQPMVAENTIVGPIPMEHGLILAGIIFAIGLCGVMVRRNFLFMLMSLEIMMSAAGLAFIVAGSHWLEADGQVMFIFILTLAAAEASLGLAILLQFYHRRGHLDIDSANEMRG